MRFIAALLFLFISEVVQAQKLSDVPNISTAREFVLDSLAMYQRPDQLHLKLGSSETYKLFDDQTYRSETSSRITDVWLEVKSEDENSLLMSTQAKLLAVGNRHQYYENINILTDAMTSAVQTQKSVFVQLNSFLPPLIRNRTNTFSKNDEYNCHRSAFDWHYPNREIDKGQPVAWFQSPEESAPYVQIQPGEALKFGDLLTVWTSCHGEPLFHSHSAIYINDELVWHKPTSSSASPWTFERSENALRLYVALQPACNVRIIFYKSPLVLN